MPLYYNPHLKKYSQKLRRNLTNAEKLLWYQIRRKQILGIQFYRQKPLGKYIVDFYAPSVKLVIELDGGQHFEIKNIQRDKRRDEYLKKLNLIVLRFDNLQVLKSLKGVVDVIFREIVRRR